MTSRLGPTDWLRYISRNLHKLSRTTLLSLEVSYELCQRDAENKKEGDNNG